MNRSAFYAFACAVFAGNAALAQTDCTRFRDHCLTQNDTRISIDVRTQNDTLDGLGALTWLRSVTLQGETSENSGVDLSVLAYLPKLETLRMYGLGAVTGFEADNLKNLAALAVVNTHFENSNALGDLPNLENLALANAGITDVSPLSGIDLKVLSLRGPGLVDLAPLGNLPQLRILNITNSEITSLDGLVFSESFQRLNASKSALSDISALASAPAVIDLNLRFSQITELTALQDLTELEKLDVRDTPLWDISKIGRLSKLRKLWLSDTLVEDISSLSALKGVQELSISRIPATDLSALAQMDGVRGLWLNETQSSDLTPLLSMSSLEVISIDGSIVSASENLKEFVANFTP